MARYIKQVNILYFVMLFLFYLFIDVTFAQLQNKAIKELENQGEKASVTSKAEPEPIVRENIEYQASNSRDPFQDTSVEKSAVKTDEQANLTPPELKIKGIIWGTNLPQAIINDQVVKIGDTVAGARIINIDKSGITVLFNNHKFNISSPATADIEAKEKKGGTNEK